MLRRFDPEKADLLASVPLQPVKHKENIRSSYGSLISSDLVTIFIYGIGGQGEEYLSLRSWLQPNYDRTVIFLVDDWLEARAFMETEVASEILKNQQIIFWLFLWPQDDNWDRLSLEFAWLYKTIPWRKFAFLAKFSATPEEGARLGILFKKFRGWIDRWHRFCRISIKGRSKFIDSYYNNLLELLNAKFGHGMANAFKGIPAIICGAGPSLHQHLDRLKALQRRALIFGSGSALNALSRHGVLPHFGGGYDPTPTQLSRLSTNFAFQVPFFYANSFNHEALKFLQGEKLSTREGINAYATDWFDEQLGLPIGPCIGTGATTSNYCFDVACFLGCNPIILTGMNLSYSDGDVRYAPGVTAHPAEERRHHTEIKGMKPHLIKVKGVDGREVVSSNHWILEADCFIASREAHPDITVWNATEGGMPIRGIPNTTLQEVMDRDLKETYDFDSWIHVLIQKHGLESIDKKKLMLTLERWHNSLRQCKGVLTTLLADLKQRLSNMQHSSDEAYIEDFTVDLDALLGDTPSYNYCLKLDNAIFEEAHEKIRFRMGHFPEAFPTRRFSEAKGFLEVKRCTYLLTSLDVHLSKVKETLARLPKYPILPRSDSSTQREALVEIEGGEAGEEVRHFYYITGEVYAIQRRFNGLLHGSQEYFFADGTPRTTLNYCGGLLDGEVRLFYPVQSSKRELHFLKGKLHGIERHWSEEGMLLKEAHYIENRPVGTMRSWHDNGVLAREVVYQEGSETCSVVEWDKHGKEINKA